MVMISKVDVAKAMGLTVKADEDYVGDFDCQFNGLRFSVFVSEHNVDGVETYLDVAYDLAAEEVFDAIAKCIERFKLL